MPMPNNLKKMFIFSNLKTRNFVEILIKEEMVDTGRSFSFLAEKHMLNDLLPADPSARIWVELMYSEQLEVNDVLFKTFNYMSEGINFKSKHSNALPLIEFVINEIFHKKTKIKPDDHIYHLKSQMESVVGYINSYCESLIDDNDNNDKTELLKELSNAKFLFNDISDEKYSQCISEYFDFLKRNWEILKEYSRTFRLLADLIHYSNIDNSNNNKFKLRVILKKVTKTWN